jgi:hypothetical protein
MLIEKNALLSWVEKFIERGCNSIQNDENEIPKIKTYFKKDENNCFTIVDKEYSIKCVFDKNFLSDYLAAQPSYVKLDNFDGKFIIDYN